ncbi:MAG: DUF5123 domain-containing protein, partial [Bacteroidales bacterium]|nr:DUF5123 domain-containing protein [Bacteroidales bacterium]
IVTATSATFEPIAGGKVYKVRIRANHEKENLSSDFGERDLDLDAEQIILAPEAGDVTKYTVKVRFPAGASVDKLEINGEEVDMTAGEIAAGIVDIADLAPGSAIKAELFLGAISRGEHIYTTLKPTGEWPANAVFMAPKDTLTAILSLESSVGKLIVLPENYDVVERVTGGIKGSVTVDRDPAGARPKVRFTRDAFNLNSVIGGTAEIIFKNIDFISTSSYFINQGTNLADGVVCDIKKIEFENCNFEGFMRSLLRAQINEQIFGEVTFNNCLFKNGGIESGQNYSLVTAGSNVTANTVFSKLVITNSTFDVRNGTFLRFQGGSAGTPVVGDIIIENCTFYNIMGMNQTNNQSYRFIDLDNVNNVANVTLKDNIFGSLGATQVPDQPGICTQQGLRGIITLTESGNWVTTSFVNQGADPGAAVPIIDVPGTSSGGSVTDLFVDAPNGNFTLKPGVSVPTTAGDPRWR